MAPKSKAKTPAGHARLLATANANLVAGRDRLDAALRRDRGGFAFEVLGELGGLRDSSSDLICVVSVMGILRTRLEAGKIGDPKAGSFPTEDLTEFCSALEAYEAALWQRCELAKTCRAAESATNARIKAGATLRCGTHSHTCIGYFLCASPCFYAQGRSWNGSRLGPWMRRRPATPEGEDSSEDSSAVSSDDETPERPKAQRRVC